MAVGGAKVVVLCEADTTGCLARVNGEFEATVKIKSKGKSNSSGQECPLHTSNGKGQSDFSDWPLI